MIARLRGRCVHLDEESLIIEDAGGVGYLVRATAGVLQAAGSAGSDGEVTAWIHTSVREDAIQLFGFASHAEQQVFEQLLTLQGVGPKVAIAVVSAYSPADIRRATDTEDVALFQSIPGIGPKVARRIVTELQGKLAGIAVGTTTFTAEVADGWLDARDALVGLGLSVQAAEAALKATDEDASTDERVRQALKAVRA